MKTIDGSYDPVDPKNTFLNGQAILDFLRAQKAVDAPGNFTVYQLRKFIQGERGAILHDNTANLISGHYVEIEIERC